MNKNTSLLILGIVATLIIFSGWYFGRSSIESTTSVPAHDMVSMGEESDTSPITQSHRSYHIESNASTFAFAPNQPTDYEFSIVDERGDAIRDFATVHEKIMHVIIVRKDLQEFQHVHPRFDEQTGTFTLTNLTLPSAGPYRIFADFTPIGTQLGPDGVPLGVTIFEDVTSGNLASYSPQPLGQATTTANVDGYSVSLATEPSAVRSNETNMLTFSVNRHGQPVTNLQPYLGALGHAVVLREGDLQFIHAHPVEESGTSQDGTVPFHVTFPETGTYKVFAQFQHQNEIFTTEFVVPVIAGAPSSMMNVEDMMPMMEPGHGAGH